MADKPARSKQIETEMTLEQVKEQLTELGKKKKKNVAFLHMKRLQNA